MGRWIAAFAVVTLLAFPARADFTAGQGLYIAGNFQGAFDQWVPLAEEGDPRAQYSLGILYQAGRGVSQDLVQAAKWYARAAGQRYQPAIVALQALMPHLEAELRARHENEAQAEAAPDPQTDTPMRRSEREAERPLGG